GRAREVEVVALVGLPSKTNLDRDGDLHGRPHRFAVAAHAIWLTRERGAQAFAREMVDGTAEIEIDEIRAARFDERRGPRELIGTVASELDAEARLGRGPPGERRPP